MAGRPAPQVIPREDAIRNAARLLNEILAAMRELEIRGGARAVAEQSHAVRDGRTVEELEELYRSLPREAPAGQVSPGVLPKAPAVSKSSSDTPWVRS